MRLFSEGDFARALIGAFLLFCMGAITYLLLVACIGLTQLVFG